MTFKSGEKDALPTISIQITRSPLASHNWWFRVSKTSSKNDSLEFIVHAFSVIWSTRIWFKSWYFSHWRVSGLALEVKQINVTSLDLKDVKYSGDFSYKSNQLYNKLNNRSHVMHDVTVMTGEYNDAFKMNSFLTFQYVQDSSPNRKVTGHLNIFTINRNSWSVKKRFYWSIRKNHFKRLIRHNTVAVLSLTVRNKRQFLCSFKEESTLKELRKKNEFIFKSPSIKSP